MKVNCVKYSTLLYHNTCTCTCMYIVFDLHYITPHPHVIKIPSQCKLVLIVWNGVDKSIIMDKLPSIKEWTLPMVIWCSLHLLIKFPRIHVTSFLFLIFFYPDVSIDVLLNISLRLTAWHTFIPLIRLQKIVKWQDEVWKLTYGPECVQLQILPMTCSYLSQITR